MENSPLIRHPSNLTGGSLLTIAGEEEAAQHSLINTETNQFLREVVEQATAGEGVGWLKLTRLRKLMEEEHYRTLVLNKLQSSIEPKVAPDDHIQDVVRVLIPLLAVLCSLTNIPPVPHQGCLQGGPEAAAGGDQWPGGQSQPQQLLCWRSELCLPPAGDLPHSLLVQGPPGQCPAGAVRDQLH